MRKIEKCSSLLQRLVVVFCFVGIRFVRETKVLLRLTFLEKSLLLCCNDLLEMVKCKMDR